MTTALIENRQLLQKGNPERDWLRLVVQCPESIEGAPRIANGRDGGWLGSKLADGTRRFGLHHETLIGIALICLQLRFECGAS